MNAQSNKIDLAQVKAAASVVNDERGQTVLWNGNEIRLTSALASQILLEGIYRQASMDSAKGGYTEQYEKDFIARLNAGFLKESDLKKAQKALEPKAGAKGVKSIAFSQLEVVAQARSMTNDKTALKTLDKIAAYDDKAFGLLLVKVSDNPESLISRAIAELTKAANDKAAAELAAALDSIDVI